MINANRLVASGTGIVIGIPTLGRPVPLPWAWAFKSMTPPINYNMVVANIHGKPVAEARNDIVREALKHEAKYLFFVGDDVVCPPHTLKQLIYRMEQDSQLGVVGGIYVSKSDPPAPLVFRGNGKGSFWDWKIGDYFSVTGLGMDCTLIRVDIFQRLKAPWFHTEDSDSFLDGRNHAEQWTEDIWFCRRVLEETSYKIYADSTILCEHWDVFGNKVYTLPANSLPYRQAVVEKGEKRIIDIGCGPIVREFKEGRAVRVDIREFEGDLRPDYICDVRQLPFGEAEFDIVFSSHVLEHFNRAEWEGVLREWIRILRPDGELRFVLPNIMWAAERIVRNQIDEHVMNVLYGAQSYPYDFHYNGFTPAILKQYLSKTYGMTCIHEDHQGYNMILTFKREQEKT